MKRGVYIEGRRAPGVAEIRLHTPTGSNVNDTLVAIGTPARWRWRIVALADDLARRCSERRGLHRRLAEWGLVVVLLVVRTMLRRAIRRRRRGRTA
jgi:hypothetical protein